jgi:cysteinyl-tRNA synthetase
LLRLYNSLGKKNEIFRPFNKKTVTMFACGPSVYQRAHIGNFRTFLFEDILARYLEYTGHVIKRGMNFTDIEDKAIREAQKNKTTVEHLAETNIRIFVKEMNILSMRMPDYLHKASECVDEAVDLIKQLLGRKIAYWHKENVYFDPLKFSGFGKLYGLDMSQWPLKKKRFHKDTYPGTQWNLGDFVLWHGCKRGDKYCWDTKIGKGRPSWNIQDASIIRKYFHETLSIYCGGIDNLYRHHDYTLAILESVRPYAMAKFWLHGNHLYVNGRKMSKSKGNILYVDDLRKQGYDEKEIRFFLVYGQYRERMNYSDRQMQLIADKLRTFKRLMRRIDARSSGKADSQGKIVQCLRKSFRRHMDNDLNVKGAFDELHEIVSDVKIDNLNPPAASGIINTLKEIDEVFKVVF